jgi:hypothetical protein
LEKEYRSMVYPRETKAGFNNICGASFRCRQLLSLSGNFRGYTTGAIVLEPLPPMPPPCSAQSGCSLSTNIIGQWFSRGTDKPYRAQIADAGANILQFSNERREKSEGQRLNPYTVQASDWGNITAELALGGKLLLWNNGTWWSRDRFDKIPTTKTNRVLAADGDLPVNHAPLQDLISYLSL